MFDRIFAMFFEYLKKVSNKKKIDTYRRMYNIHPTARLNYPENIWFKGNIAVGPHTYINSGRFVSGLNCQIEIGEWCAIGHNVSMIGWTHDLIISTGPENERPSISKDIIIGNRVWIGNNVFIKEVLLQT